MRVINLALIGIWMIVCVLPVAAQLQPMINGWDISGVPEQRTHPLDIVEIGEWMIIRSGGGNPGDMRRELRESGWHVEAFLPRDGWLAQVRQADSARAWLRGRAAMKEHGADGGAIISMEARWKVRRDLWQQRSDFSEHQNLSLVVYHIGQSDALRNLIEAAGATVASVPQSAGKGRLGVRVAGNQLEHCLNNLVSHASVYSIQVGGGARLLNDNASQIVQSGAAGGGALQWNRGLRGEGQVIAVLDTGLDYDSCYFAESGGAAPPLALGSITGTPDLARRKVIIYDLLFSGDWGAGAGDFDNQGHGTAVSGNALGSRLGFEFSTAVNNGVAPAAKLVVQDAGFTGFDDCADLAALQCPVVDLSPFLDQAIAQGAHIHNNSWGDRENFFPQNTYTAPTADMDDAIWRNPDFVIVCAAGNSGGMGDDSVGSPSVGKNVISAAATQSPSAGGSAENITNFSSRGWTSDGRIKPDLAAPGQTISARGDGSILTENCTTQLIQGTSMASPITAACAAIVRQYYAEGWYPSGMLNGADAFVPSSALIKATLLNGAADMTGVAGAPPNRTEGWGRVDLERSLFFDGDERRLIAIDERDYFTTSTVSAWQRLVMADGNATGGDIRVTLVWTDYPASPAATSALVNDLDLIVRDISSDTSYRGNNLDAVTGLSLAGGVADQINNVEMVALPAGFSGTLEITVESSLLIEAPQGFALVIGGGVNEPFPSAVEEWTQYDP